MGIDPKAISPIEHIVADQPPVIMFFGTADGLLKGAELFRQRSEKAGNTCQILTYEGEKHGFFNYGKNGGKRYQQTLAAADKFLVDLGWLQAK